MEWKSCSLRDSPPASSQPAMQEPAIRVNGKIKRIKENIRIIKKLPRAKGFASISYPGENKAKRFSKNSKKKINLPGEIEKDLEKLIGTSS